MKRLCRTFCVCLAAIMIAITAHPAAYADTSISSITSAGIKKKQQQISDAEKAKKSLKESISNTKKMKEELEGLKEDAEAYIQKVDEQMATVQRNIDDYAQKIADKEAEIAEIEVELEEAIELEKTWYESMKAQIKFMYEQGDTFYMDLMLNAKGFGDFLTKAQYVEQLSDYNKKTMDNYTAAREWTEVCEAALISEKSILDEAKACQEEEYANLNDLLVQKTVLIDNLESDITKKATALVEYEEEYEAETAAIEKLEAQILAEQKEIAARQKVTYNGGKFAFPCPGYVAVTDDFGWRTDPISHVTAYHSGIDLGAPAGSSILAAYDGMVVAAAYDSSMGNYIMINHGDGLYTIYMHTREYYVKVNDVVAKGEKIAAVGTTGRSTGYHLHFGVRLNGQYVSPWPYFGK